ncbi:MAG: hypothetical protein LCH43_00400 [Actinobacteria bacterium]|nr:hypothetical protein [Actinomycetota bacterium]
MTDETTPESPSPDAQALLAAAAEGAEAGTAIAHRARVASGAFAITVGVLIALFLLGTIYVYPLGQITASVAITVAYGVLLVAAALLYRWGRPGATPGWRQQYAKGFVITIVLYAVGISVSTSTQSTTPALWVPWAVATALPLVIVGLRPERG